MRCILLLACVFVVGCDRLHKPVEEEVVSVDAKVIAVAFMSNQAKGEAVFGHGKILRINSKPGEVRKSNGNPEIYDGEAYFTSLHEPLTDVTQPESRTIYVARVYFPAALSEEVTKITPGTPHVIVAKYKTVTTGDDVVSVWYEGQSVESQP